MEVSAYRMGMYSEIVTLTKEDYAGATTVDPATDLRKPTDVKLENDFCVIYNLGVNYSKQVNYSIIVSCDDKEVATVGFFPSGEFYIGNALEDSGVYKAQVKVAYYDNNFMKEEVSDWTTGITYTKPSTSVQAPAVIWSNIEERTIQVTTVPEVSTYEVSVWSVTDDGNGGVKRNEKKSHIYVNDFSQSWVEDNIKNMLNREAGKYVVAVRSLSNNPFTTAHSDYVMTTPVEVVSNFEDDNGPKRTEWDYNGYKIIKESYDTPDGKWYIPYVQFVFNRGLMSGTEGGFEPDTVLTREMFAQILHSQAGKPAVTEENPFSDVEAGKWYEKAIVWAYSNGIVSGMVDTPEEKKFGVETPITREQLALMMYRYAETTGMDISITGDVIDNYADVNDVSDWATLGVKWAISHNVMSGKPGEGNTMILDPLGEATRAECATMVMRLVTME